MHASGLVLCLQAITFLSPHPATPPPPEKEDGNNSNKSEQEDLKKENAKRMLMFDFEA